MSNKNQYTFKNKRYITRGVENKVPIELQIYIWDLILSLDIEKDYLQVFKLSFEKIDDEQSIQKIIHTQEVPEYIGEHIVNVVNPVDCKIYVIDDITHSTMLLASEY